MSYLSELSAHQLQNAHGIIAAVVARKWPAKAAYIAVEAALDESGMRILASANVPASQRYPHDLLSWTSDGLGHDHASMGMFQQQTGYRWTPAGVGRAMNQTTINTPDGWGTPAELMNAEKSTAKFLNKLAAVDWRHMTNWAAAQDVQGSAFPDGSNYRDQDARARAIVDALWSIHTTDSGSTTALGDLMASLALIQDTKTKRRYFCNGIDRPLYVSLAAAKAIRVVHALPAAHPVSHDLIVKYDAQMARRNNGVTR